VGCIRALTETQSVGYVFYVGANSIDDVPELFLWDEIRTRIGAQNYRNLANPSVIELKDWVKELFKTLVLKGDVPAPHVKAIRAMTPAALEATVHPDILAITTGSTEALDAYPFTPEALDEFANQCAADNLANRPR